MTYLNPRTVRLNGDTTGFLFVEIKQLKKLNVMLRCVGAINGFQPIQKAVRAMTYLNPRSAPLNDDIIGFTSVDLKSRDTNSENHHNYL